MLLKNCTDMSVVNAHLATCYICIIFLFIVGEVETALKMTAEDFLKKYGAPKPSEEDTNIVFHCRAGVRSLDAMETAHQLGYKKYVFRLLGHCLLSNLPPPSFFVTHFSGHKSA